MSRYLGRLVASPRVKPKKWALNPARVDPKWRHVWDHACVVYPLWAQSSGASDTPFGREYVNKQEVTSVSTPAWINETAGGYGVGRQFTLASDYDIVLPDLSLAHNEPIDACTVLIIRRNHVTDDRASSSFGVNSSGASLLNCHMPFSDAKVYWDFGGTASRAIWAHVKTDPASLVLDYWTLTAGPDGSIIYFNGLERAATAGDAPRTSSADALWLNRGVGGTSGDGVNNFLFCVFNNQWNAAQVAEWYADPYGLIREEYPAHKSRVWSTQVAAAGGIEIFRRRIEGHC